MTVLQVLRQTTLRLALWGVLSFAVGSAGAGLLVFWMNSSSPVKLLSTSVVDAVAHDGKITLRIKTERDKICEQSVDRMLWHWVQDDGKRLQDTIPLVKHDVPIRDQIGADEYLLTLPIPVTVTEDGEWYYQSVVWPHCSQIRVDPPIYSKSVAVRVVVAKKEDPK